MRWPSVRFVSWKLTVAVVVLWAVGFVLPLLAFDGKVWACPRVRGSQRGSRSAGCSSALS